MRRRGIRKPGLLPARDGMMFLYPGDVPTAVPGKKIFKWSKSEHRT